MGGWKWPEYVLSPCTTCTFCHPGTFCHHALPAHFVTPELVVSTCILSKRTERFTRCTFCHPFASNTIISLSLPSMCVCVCVRARSCLRACMRVCVRVCVRAYRGNIVLTVRRWCGSSLIYCVRIEKSAECTHLSFRQDRPHSKHRKKLKLWS